MSVGLAVAQATSAYKFAADPYPDPWYAVRVKSRFEFATSAALGERGYETFLPCYLSRWAWSDRIKELEMPLFPGMFFAGLTPGTCGAF